MPLNWQLEPGRCLSLLSLWNPSLGRKINWWWWVPSNLPKTKIWLLEIRRWIQKSKENPKIHLSKRETRKRLKRSPHDPRRTPKRRITKDKWESTHIAVRAIIMRSLLWKIKLTCWPKSWRRTTSPFLIARRRGKEDQIHKTRREYMPWLLAPQAHLASSLILELPDIWFQKRGILLSWHVERSTNIFGR